MHYSTLREQVSSNNVSKAITIQHGCEYMHNFILLSKIEQKLCLISVKPVHLLGGGRPYNYDPRFSHSPIPATNRRRLAGCLYAGEMKG